MKEKHALRWKKAREAGKAAWVIKRGVLGWGLAMLAFQLVQRRDDPERYMKLLIVDLPLWLIAGGLWGILMWHAMEWQYRKFVDDHGEPGM